MIEPEDDRLWITAPEYQKECGTSLIKVNLKRNAKTHSLMTLYRNDLVMSFDFPISYTYPHQEKTISELVRLARKRIMISVSSRLGALPYLANPIQKNQFILDKDCKDGWVQWCFCKV